MEIIRVGFLAWFHGDSAEDRGGSGSDFAEDRGQTLNINFAVLPFPKYLMAVRDKYV